MQHSISVSWQNNLKEGFIRVSPPFSFMVNFLISFIYIKWLIFLCDFVNLNTKTGLEMTQVNQAKKLQEKALRRKNTQRLDWMKRPKKTTADKTDNITGRNKKSD